MTGVLHSVGRFSARHRYPVIGLWILVAVALVVISNRAGSKTSEDLTLPGTGSTQGRDGVAKAWFGKRTAATATQVHIDSRGRITLGGTVETLRLHRPSTGYGLAFARFLSGRR